MAWTVTKVDEFNTANKITKVFDITTDSAESTITTGLAVIKGFQLGPQSISTAGAGIHIYHNSGSTGTAIAGALGCSGFTSGDEFFLTVFGT